MVHDGQVDKAGEPYVGHLERVAGRARVLAIKAGFDIASREVDQVVQIAWLHDVIEDTEYEASDLVAEGFSASPVVECVAWLTKTGNEPYTAWIERLCECAPLTALLVKLADIEDNSDPARLAKLDEATRTRLARKYTPAKERLREAIEQRRRG